MKLAILSLLLVLTTVLAQASGDVKRVKLNQETEIQVGEMVSVGGLKIRFVTVAEDSRCPEGVKCVWAGNGKIVLKVSKAGKHSANINLNTGIEPKHILYAGYDIKLVSLNPYPKEGEKIKKGDYVATLVVNRK
jgi:biotin carboxyl carrier protein